MNKKHFVAPIILQWIEKIQDPSSTTFVKENYVSYLEQTKSAIENALIKYNLEKKK